MTPFCCGILGDQSVGGHWGCQPELVFLRPIFLFISYYVLLFYF